MGRGPAPRGARGRGHPLNLLCLSRYDAAGPSSRYRLYQYLPRLEAAGFVVEVAPLFDSGYVTRLYRGAACAAYVSLYEGFGLPVLEAMACGTAVVSSDLPPVLEFARGVVTVDPRDPDSIAAGLNEALDHRDELGREGRAAATAYDWARVAR